MISLNFLQLCILGAFLGVNLWILVTDIHARKIRNISLIALIGILPFWVWIFSPTMTISLPQIILSVILLIGGVFLYHDSPFLGSGDIKYASILILFLGAHPLSGFVGNIAVLTLLCLFFWLVILLGYIYQARSVLGMETLKEQISPKIQKNEIHLYILAYILDFGIVGFLFSQLIPQIGILLSYRIEMSENLYFLIFLIVFLIRPWTNFLITRWKYHIGPIFLIGIYFVWFIQNYGFSTLYSQILHYGSYIWIYILLYIIIRYISNSIYRIYDHVSIGGGEYFKTIPYSIVIFLAFVLLYSFNTNLM